MHFLFRDIAMLGEDNTYCKYAIYRYDGENSINRLAHGIVGIASLNAFKLGEKSDSQYYRSCTREYVCCFPPFYLGQTDRYRNPVPEKECNIKLIADEHSEME